MVRRSAGESDVIPEISYGKRLLTIEDESRTARDLASGTTVAVA